MKKWILYTSLLVPFIGCSVSSVNTVTLKPVIKKSGELAFPVSGNTSKVGSFWGDGRDAGKRKHEGIDIFAKKGTKVVAVCDGTVSTGNGGIGGKTVWLKADDFEWTAYYAHLDSQYVYGGQSVKRGDVLGTVGNTGNARLTPAHLHFGIYTYSGAIDPYPIVNTAPRIILEPGTNAVENAAKPVTSTGKINARTKSTGPREKSIKK
jgi:murein DD-endopeptidase MepM/ murein hydrolase activator NlpD